MKDEIKEILDDLLFTTTLPNVSVKLSNEKLYQLKGYITNLQEENERLANELNNCMIERNNFLSRNEKAIEYIKMYKCDYSPYELTDYAIRNVLNILKGSE